MSIFTDSFNWKAFARYLQTFSSTVVPIGHDGYPWEGWEKLKGKEITNDDLDRWIASDNFNGFGIHFGNSKIPVVFPPTIDDLKKTNPYILAFATLPIEKLDKSIDWQGFVSKLDELIQKNGKRK